MALTEKQFQDHMRELRLPAQKGYMPPRARVQCADGFSMSVQAGYGKYSSPRDDIEGDYAKWEIGFPSDEPITAALRAKAENANALKDTVYGYVTTAEVMAEIEAHGGIASEEEAA